MDRDVGSGEPRYCDADGHILFEVYDTSASLPYYFWAPPHSSSIPRTTTLSRWCHMDPERYLVTEHGSITYHKLLGFTKDIVI
ncbi:unnamed protein product [Fusarium graminearum]|uniref:Chromosome 3, complete genome n=1 Tax=Gibberella zeae (strain ATCC MYA-4620 / CBS 123657 / FGSC 9075 / NRRL 31084 / PH-1) TaxID=229533 RepID=A0A098E059_GIBZE|nr:unnamed protein product [Fusarium graminearum]CZS86038.1 unnamed protein product [Fusarium graminearum]